MSGWLGWAWTIFKTSLERVTGVGGGLVRGETRSARSRGQNGAPGSCRI